MTSETNPDPTPAPTGTEVGAAEATPLVVREVVERNDESEIREAIHTQITELVSIDAEMFNGAAALALYDPNGSIGDLESDRLLDALAPFSNDKTTDVVLFLVSPGGGVEPAYQIAKMCKFRAKSKFTVLIPSRAKSAATLIALGADEIHMGMRGELGPIDPQLKGLPALGVLQAITLIAQLADKHPGSAEMFARYLGDKLDIEQIGYCERIGESAVQYAERLLATKTHLTGDRAKDVARKLVYEFKDHRFVIDSDEARAILGSELIKTGTKFAMFAEMLYRTLSFWTFWLETILDRNLEVIGHLTDEASIFTYAQRMRQGSGGAGQAPRITTLGR